MSLRRFRRRPHAAEMSCRELVRLVTDYLEGALPESDRLRFERHISQCDGCTTYMDQIRETIRATGELTETSLDRRTAETLLAAFRDWDETRR
jgi:anti-sigma factor RsiW